MILGFMGTMAMGRARTRHRVVTLLLGVLLGLGFVFTPAIASPAQLPTPESVPQYCANPSAWIRLDGKNVLEIRSAPGAQQLSAFAARGSRTLAQWTSDFTVQPEQIVLKEEPPYTLIGVKRGSTFAASMAVDDRGSACFGLKRQELATRYRDSLRRALSDYRRSHTQDSWLRGTALALLVLGVYVLWLHLQTLLRGRIQGWIDEQESGLFLRVQRRSGQLLDPAQIRSVLQALLRLIHWGLLLLVSYLLIPLLLGFFPPTQGIAEGLRGQILALVGNLLAGVLATIPNLFSILVIIVIATGVGRCSNAWFKALDRGRVRIPGFYQEWAMPTARLATILIVLASVVLAYPYIPGSSSKAFQGAGLLLGALAALGSSAIATNIISGLMLIYTRAFRKGDRVEINGTIGVVQDRALLVTLIKTPRNELVSIPNATVISASILNFSFSRREISRPVAIATTVTIGYDVPWRRVHELMLAAADSVEGITDEVSPSVLQTSLNDFHISYELNAFVRDVDSYRQTLSDLLAALQDQFAAAQVEILSPGYHAIRSGRASTLPPTYGTP